jgi:hypothetical protein
MAPTNEDGDLARMDTTGDSIDSRTASAVAPTSRPETAFELLELVARHIEEEPRRYNQEMWVLRGLALKTLGLEPPCGTVCCRAGWIVALHDGLDAADNMTAEDRAIQILDVPHRVTAQLFSALSINYWSDAAGAVVGPSRGTPEYAKAGADGIRAFMATHEGHLKARKLADVPKAEGR